MNIKKFNRFILVIGIISVVGNAKADELETYQAIQTYQYNNPNSTEYQQPNDTFKQDFERKTLGNLWGK